MAQRVPTVDDLRLKLCYICREEESFDNPPVPARTWTHPCNCTLIAHESCLLEWIRSAQQDSSRAANALKCPQCGAKYELESDRPALLRILDHLNRAASAAGRLFTFAAASGVVVCFGSGIYVILTAYGAYAVEQYLGKEMFDLVLTSDPGNWPWHAFFNLPLIPISLILSRSLFSRSSLSCLHLFLAWPTAPPVGAWAAFRGLDNHPDTFNPAKRILLDPKIYPTSITLGPDVPLVPSPLLAFPPSPLVCALLFPLIQSFYRRHFDRFSHWVLNHTHPHHDTLNVPLRRIVWALGDGPAAALRIRIGPNAEGRAARAAAPNGAAGGNRNAAAGAGAGDGAAGAVGGAAADANAEAAERTIRISGASAGRLVGGALLIPRISSFMGALLLSLSKRGGRGWAWLRALLAARPPLDARELRLVGLGLAPKSAATLWGLRPDEMKGGPRTAVAILRLIWGGSRLWAESDPVWWRNSIGLGLFVVVKDCVSLLHLWLTKRELESRRVRNRAFAGIDARELDLIDGGAFGV